MKKFLKQCFYFIAIGLVLGEIISRVFYLTSDIPRRTIDQHGIQKYYPEQEGYWVGGNHKWQINRYGWPGPLPESMDNLILILGDSYIENFMNPTVCHQSVILKRLLPKYNYMEASRSGVSFIEALEISQHVDSLNPKLKVLYLFDSDFYESIVQINRVSSITQVDIDRKKIIPGSLRNPGIKAILYNWKFAYYLYNRFPINMGADEGDLGLHSEARETNLERKRMVKELLSFAKERYQVDDFLLVFRPTSDPFIVEASEEIGFKTLLLEKSNSESWNFDNDPHWNCTGHEKVAEQVAQSISLWQSSS